QQPRRTRLPHPHPRRRRPPTRQRRVDGCRHRAGAGDHPPPRHLAAEHARRAERRAARHPRRGDRAHEGVGRTMNAMFRSLRFFNYRVWFIGAIVSNVGTWMQSTAQNWVVLTELTDLDATAVGVTMALQFAPPLLLVPVTGW